MGQLRRRINRNFRRTISRCRPVERELAPVVTWRRHRKVWQVLVGLQQCRRSQSRWCCGSSNRRSRQDRRRWLLSRCDGMWYRGILCYWNIIGHVMRQLIFWRQRCDHFRRQSQPLCDQLVGQLPSARECHKSKIILPSADPLTLTDREQRRERSSMDNRLCTFYSTGLSVCLLLCGLTRHHLQVAERPDLCCARQHTRMSHLPVVHRRASSPAADMGPFPRPAGLSQSIRARNAQQAWR